MLTTDEKKELERLIAMKKKQKLNKEDFKRFSDLMKKTKGKDESSDGFKSKPKELGEPGNDVRWWIKEPALIRDAANLASNWIAGTELVQNIIPFIPVGVVKFNLQSTYGTSVSATDPLNVWARDLYLKMFQKYRGITAYSAADLACVLIAEIEIVKLIAKAERIYGVINRYSKLNVNMPTVEVEALGLTQTEADYLRTHLSDFRYDLNHLIKKSQRLCIMKDLSVLADALSLFAYEYKDHDNAKAQIIIFDTIDYGIFDDTTLTTGSSVRFDNPNVLGKFIDTTAPNICSALDVALNALLGSDGAQRILADLVVWFGEDSMLQMLPVPEDFVVTPVYNEQILHKMHNIENPCYAGSTSALKSVCPTAMAAADKAVLTALDNSRFVFQYNGVVVSKIYSANFGGTPVITTVGGSDYILNPNPNRHCLTTIDIIDTYRAEPDIETIVEGVLFKFGLSIIQSSGNYAHEFNTCAFYVCRNVVLFTLTSLGVTQNVISLTDSSGVDAHAGQMAILDWAPLNYYCGSNSMNNVTGVYGDVDTPIPVSVDAMRRLHNAIIYSGLHSDAQVIK